MAKRQQVATAGDKGQRRQGPRVKVITNEDQKSEVAPAGGTVQEFMSSIGTVSPDFLNTVIEQLSQHATHLVTLENEDGDEYTSEQLSEAKINSLLAMVQGIQPADELEGMLAAQMAVTHNIAMIQAKRTARATDCEVFEVNERAMSKAMRTFSKQSEALTKYRARNGSSVTVQHVHVSGGQAVVGDVHAPSPKKKTG